MSNLLPNLDTSLKDWHASADGEDGLDANGPSSIVKMFPD